MTKQQYELLTRKARRSIQSVPTSVMKQVKKIYEKIIDEVADITADLPFETFAQEISTNVRLIQRLSDASEELATSISDNTLEAIYKDAQIVNNVNRDHLVNAGLDEERITKMLEQINKDAVVATTNRVWQNGYNFSQNVWKVGQAVQDDIKNVLSAGITQGRDPFDIAKDLQVYLKDGKVQLMKRYGKLEAGTREFTARIPKKIDYRAVRLVRTEIYNSMRDVQVLGGEANPGTTGEYNWIRQFGAAHFNCACPDLAAGSPYRAEDIPGTPHPNCSCYIQAILRDQNEFTKDLKRWLDGEDVGYLDEWADKYGY